MGEFIMAKNLTNQLVSKPLSQGRYFDTTKGFHLYVKKDGKKYWVFRYSINGNRHDLGLGPYPDISLATARAKAIEFRGMLLKGQEPAKGKCRKNQAAPKAITFKDFACDFIATNEAQWKNKKHADQWRNTLRDYVYPVIGDRSLDSINTNDVLDILNPIWGSKTETATRIRGRVERILSAAITRQLRAGPNPASWKGHLENILPKLKKSRRVKHHAAMPRHQIKGFIEQLREKECISALALEFLILTASRTNEVQFAKWSEIYEDVWIIPAARMKAEREHRVPLSARCINILKIAKSVFGESEYLFHRSGRPLSNMAMAKLLKRIHPQYTVHGFRSTFRDWVSEETEVSGELAEMALAHSIGNRVEASYRRGDMMARRRFLMDSWLQYCENGAVSYQVIDMRRAA